MANPPRGFRKETREVFIPKNSDFSDSRKHRGHKSALARDRDTNGLSHAVIGDPVEPGAAPARVVYVDRERERVVEVSAENAPDISRLVPLALVAVAGIAAGMVGVRAIQNAKTRRQTAHVEMPQASSSTATPAGWYEDPRDPSRLRYWSGAAWTNDYAQRAGSAPSIAADWYPDPSNSAQLRYWDGAAWTHHTSPRPGAVTTPADWYPDPSNAAQLRYWDGAAWTSHVTAGPAAASTSGPLSGHALAPAYEQSRINMSSAEWQSHVRAWLQAGAIQQELWRRLAYAQIQDADDATLAAQRRMEELTPEEGARRIQRLLEASPALRDQGALLEFIQLFGSDHRVPIGIDMKHNSDR